MTTTSADTLPIITPFVPADCRVTLKSVRVAQHLSESSAAFTATVYFDGKRLGGVRNDGRGGCNRYDFVMAGAGTPIYDYAHDLCMQTQGHAIEALDHLIGEIIDEHDLTRHTTRLLKNGYKRVFVGFSDRREYPGRLTPGATITHWGSVIIMASADRREYPGRLTPGATITHWGSVTIMATLLDTDTAMFEALTKQGAQAYRVLASG